MAIDSSGEYLLRNCIERAESFSDRPEKVGCSKSLNPAHFLTYSIDALDHQIWRKVFIRPFRNVTVSSFLQSLFKIEISFVSLKRKNLQHLPTHLLQ